MGFKVGALCATRTRFRKTNNNNELTKSFRSWISSIKLFRRIYHEFSLVRLKKKGGGGGKAWNSIVRCRRKGEKKRKKIKEACNWQSDDSWPSDPYVSPLPLDDSGFCPESTASSGVVFVSFKIRELTTLLTNWHSVWRQLNPGGTSEHKAVEIKGERRQRSVNGTSLRKGEETGKRETNTKHGMSRRYSTIAHSSLLSRESTTCFTGGVDGHVHGSARHSRDLPVVRRNVIKRNGYKHRPPPLGHGQYGVALSLAVGKLTSRENATSDWSIAPCVTSGRLVTYSPVKATP